MRTKIKVLLIITGILLAGYLYGKVSQGTIDECMTRGYSYDYCVIATG